MSIQDVYQAVVEAGAPLVLPEPWQNLACDSSFFRLTDSSVVFNKLQARFEHSVLLESGVALAGDVDIVMNPLLTDPNTIVWALRKQKDASPFQLIANFQCVRPKFWTFGSALSDYRMSPMIREAGDRVAVVFSMEDLAILWSLQIPAVPYKGLQFMPGQALVSFRKLMCMELGSTEGASPFADCARVLVLFDWSISRMEPFANQLAEEIWQYWRNLQKHLDLAVDEFEWLRPTVAELSRMHFIVKHRDWDQIRDTIFDGPYENAQSLQFDPSQKHCLPGSLADALRKWRRTVLAGASDETSRKVAWNDVRSIYDRQHIDLLLDRASKSSDPAEQSMVLALAELSRLLFPQMVHLTEKVSQAVGEKRTGSSNPVPKEEYQQVLAGIDRILALQQGIQACRAKKPFQMIRAPRPKVTSVDLKDSILAPKNSPPYESKDSSRGKGAVDR